jgi:predicted SprT family Zn-dependent metalloprotease
MTNKTPTQLQFAAYQGLFNYFNKELFSEQLPNVLLNFSRKAKTLGFFAPKRWERAEVAVHEISLNPVYFKTMPFKDIASTLVHEMAHLWQQDFGKPSKGGYHNEEWAKKMDTLGLPPSSTGKPGGKRVGHRMSNYIADDGPFAKAFEAMPAELALPFACHAEPAGKRAKANKVKYICPGCQVKVWGKAGLTVRCGDCDECFTEVA